MTKILNVAGARPNFMKIAPIIKAMERHGGFRQVLVHTGQHYDQTMSDVFFDQLNIPRPDVNLEVGAGERDAQIAKIMARFDPVLAKEAPDAVLVVGDVNSTVACARVARARGVPIVHVEAGLRSFDATMPEELNRVETDHLSDYLFVTEPSGMNNLRAECAKGRVYMVGNVMIDCLTMQLDRVRACGARCRFGLQAGQYIVATFHRPSNVDTRDRLDAMISLIRFTCERVPMVLPLHPRTRASLERHGLFEVVRSVPNLKLTEPLGYIEFISLVSEAMGVVTDSGGIQEESTYLGVPCITMRDNTERPITVEVGTNVLAGTRFEDVSSAVENVVLGRHKVGKRPDLWDGAAAERIVAILSREIA